MRSIEWSCAKRSERSSNSPWCARARPIPRSPSHGTPRRVEKAFRYYTQGYSQSAADIVGGALFEAETDEMVVVKDIELKNIDVDAEHNDRGQIAVHKLNVDLAGGRASGSGAYDIEGQHGWTDLWVRGLDWHTLPIPLPTSLTHLP